MMRYLGLLTTFAMVVGLGSGFGPLPRAVAQVKGAAPPENALAEMLEEQIDMKDFQIPGGISLKDVLSLFYEILALKGKELPIIIDTDAFKTDQAVAVPFESVVRFPPFPKKMTLRRALEFSIKSIQPQKAVYLVRPDRIEITSEKYAVPAKQMVRAKFANVPLEDALSELSRQTGIGILVDPRAGEKARTLIKATFPSNTNLVTATGLLADMAGLQLRVVDRTLYVTLPTNDVPLPTKKPAPPKPNLEK